MWEQLGAWLLKQGWQGVALFLLAAAVVALWHDASSSKKFINGQILAILQESQALQRSMGECLKGIQQSLEHLRRTQEQQGQALQQVMITIARMEGKLEKED